MRGLLLSSVLLLAASPALAGGDLVYRPLSPGLGGNPFNGEFLLESALAQRKQQEDETSFEDNLEASLEARLVGAITGEIEERLFGENPQDEGSFAIGAGRTVEFERVGEIVNLRILDADTGGVTEIEIPAPRF